MELLPALASAVTASVFNNRQVFPCSGMTCFSHGIYVLIGLTMLNLAGLLKMI